MKLKKIIKTVLVSLTIAVSLSLSSFNVFAAGFSVSANKSSVAPGGKFTVRVSVGGAGQFSVSASNGSVSNSSIWAEGSASFTVTAGQSGKTTVTVTAVDVTASDESPVNGSKSVTVSIKQPTNGGGSNTTNNNTTTKPQEDTRSKENNLSSLSVSTGSLSPAFSSAKTSYKVELTSDVKEITISAKPKDSKANVSGTGKHELKIGENNFSVTVKAENGAKKTYTVSVYVTEKPTVFVTYGDQSLGVLNDLSKTDVPKGFEPTKLEIDKKEVTALKNDKLGLTLLYLQDSHNKNGFYVYENNEVTGNYQTLDANGKTYIVIPVPKNLKGTENLKFSKVKIGDMELDGWSYEDKNHANYAIVYLMNEAGEKNLYSYEKTEGTLQKYVVSEEKKVNNTLTYVLAGTTALFALSTLGVYVMYMNFKKKSIATIKDYYDRKNQG